jgi:hypothetical protein
MTSYFLTPSPRSFAVFKLFAAFVLSSVFAFASVTFADAPGAHPAYLHALTDLRTARWHLDQRGGSRELKASDHDAIQEIDYCIDEIKKASIDDGKNLNDHPKEDAGKDKQGHVHRARQLLEKAKKDILEKEDNQFANGLRDRAVHHLDEAMKHIDHSLEIGK